MTMLYVNSHNNNFLFKVVSYEKKKSSNGKVKLTLYIEKKEDYVTLKEFCKDLNITEKAEILCEIIKHLYSFHKNYVVINTLSPHNIFVNKKDRKQFCVDIYSTGMNSTGVDYIDPKTKFNAEIRFSSKTFLLFNVTEFANDFYSIAMIIYDMFFEEPFKNCNNNEILDLMRQNQDFLKIHQCKNEKISPSNVEILTKIIERCTNVSIKTVFYPLSQANTIITELRKINV